MTISTPLWMQGGTYLAKVDRNLFYNLWDEGVMDRTAFKVTQRGAGANLSVDVAAGDCVVKGDDQSLQGNYLVKSDATSNVTGFTAPGSNSRYDIVGVQINDPDAGGAAGSTATIIRVAGTAAASPTIPALPNSFLLLAIIGPILPATTSIPNSMIHDAYTGTGPTGVTGARLIAGKRDRPGSRKEGWYTVAENGWLLETGAAVSRSTYAALFEEIGTTHGVGDGATTFNLPDSRGRTAVAADNMGGSDAGLLSSANAVGTKMGAETHTLTQAETPVKSHTHGVTDPQHFHTANTSGTSSGQVVEDLPGSTAKPTGTTGPIELGTVAFPPTNLASTGISIVAASDATASAHSIMQPSITVYGMIRT